MLHREKGGRCQGNPHITDELMFRDYLRVNLESFKEYEQVKLEASLKYRYSPRDYADAKHNTIIRIMERARKHYANGGGGV